MLTGLFVAVLLFEYCIGNWCWPFTFDGGTLLFPLSYIFSDILPRSMATPARAASFGQVFLA